MRSGHQHDRFTNPGSKMFGVDLHRFTELEKDADNYEIALEFGLSLKEVKALKNRLDRG